jgi:hypothetical protein
MDSQMLSLLVQPSMLFTHKTVIWLSFLFTSSNKTMVVLHDLSDREMRCIVISRGCIGANTANTVVEQTQAHGNRTFAKGVQRVTI